MNQQSLDYCRVNMDVLPCPFAGGVNAVRNEILLQADSTSEDVNIAIGFPERYSQVENGAKIKRADLNELGYIATYVYHYLQFGKLIVYNPAIEYNNNSFLDYYDPYTDSWYKIVSIHSENHTAPWIYDEFEEPDEIDSLGVCLTMENVSTGTIYKTLGDFTDTSVSPPKVYKAGLYRCFKEDFTKADGWMRLGVNDSSFDDTRVPVKDEDGNFKISETGILGESPTDWKVCSIGSGEAQKKVIKKELPTIKLLSGSQNFWVGSKYSGNWKAPCNCYAYLSISQTVSCGDSHYHHITKNGTIICSANGKRSNSCSVMLNEGDVVTFTSPHSGTHVCGQVSWFEI